MTDVAGVRVGHTTLIEGNDVRTGVTAVVHDALTGRHGPSAGLAIGNGYGKMVGTTQVGERRLARSAPAARPGPRSAVRGGNGRH
jgi:D-aminopeptidase